MKKNVLKPIIGGMVLGVIVFFTGPLLLLVLLLKFIFTPFGMGRMRIYQRLQGVNGFYLPMRFAMADNIRSMSDEEFTSFKERMNNRSHCKKFNHQ